jgi:hypothetical protein
MYSDRAPSRVCDQLVRAVHEEVTADDGTLSRVAQRYGLLMTADIVRGARAVIVDGAAMARRLVLDQGARGPAPPIVIGGESATGIAARVLELVAELGGLTVGAVA